MTSTFIPFLMLVLQRIIYQLSEEGREESEKPEDTECSPSGRLQNQFLHSKQSKEIITDPLPHGLFYLICPQPKALHQIHPKIYQIAVGTT